MIEISLFNSLCGEFTLNFMQRRKKKMKQLDAMKKDIQILMTDGIEGLHQHVLNKVVQFTQSEFGFIAKPAGTTVFNIEMFAQTDHVTRDAEYRCITDSVIHEKVFKESKVFIDNKTSERYPLIKRFAAFPIVHKGEPVAFIIVCNKFKTYKKKEIQPVKEMLEDIAYIFTNQLFL